MLTLTKAELLRLYKHKIINSDTFYKEMEGIDINKESADLLVEEEKRVILTSALSLSDAFKAYHSGLISGKELMDYLEKHEIDPKSFWIYYQLHTKTLPRADIQRLWDRGLISQRSVESWAKKQGHNKADTQLLTLLILHKRLLEEEERYEKEIMSLWMKNEIPWPVAFKYLSSLGWKEDELNELYYTGKLKTPPEKEE